jgi:AraC-like DNA-binding protein
MRSRVRSPPPRPLPSGSIEPVEQIQSSAPVSAFAEIDIAATDREVWTVLADIASWPSWNPAVRHAVCDLGEDQSLEVGAKFRFSTEIGTIRCRMTEVDAPHRFSWQGRVLVLGERQTWRIGSGPSGTRVTVMAEMTGLSSRLFKRRLTERLQRVIDALVQLLRLESEARALEEREDAQRAAAMEGSDSDHE